MVIGDKNQEPHPTDTSCISSLPGFQKRSLKMKINPTKTYGTFSLLLLTSITTTSTTSAVGTDTISDQEETYGTGWKIKHIIQIHVFFSFF